MFALAIVIGIYSYSLFALGLAGMFYKSNIIFFTLSFFLVIFFLFRNKISFLKFPKLNFILTLIILQSLVNFIGALGPELGFDALWYHLTIPKIYLMNHVISHIPGGLFYYSDMPKLTEMLYSAGLSFGSEIYPKLINYLFGILILFVLYKVSRRFLSFNNSILAVLIFSSNLVFSWQSTTAYADLARTFFELMAFWALLHFYANKDKAWLWESSVMLGLSISTKLLSLGSMFIFICLLFIIGKNLNEKIKYAAIFSIVSLIISSPWFIFSFLETGNPIYPIFTNFYHLSAIGVNPLVDFWNLFTGIADPISPLYLIFLPLVVFGYRKLRGEKKLVFYYALFSLIVWYFIPRTGGGRFILPYLPIFSLLVGLVLENLSINLKRLSILIIILVSIISIVYRGAANFKYVPVIFDFESKDKFLTRNLNFSYGDFYDTDGYFRTHLKTSDKVLLYGFHNLFYVDFPFIDFSFIKMGDVFNYIATQNSPLPERFKFWNLVYSNAITGVKLYTLDRQKWVF